MTATPGDVRRSVAVAIPHPDDAGRVLVVQRPSDDPDLPLAWGLPAASLRAGESWDDAVRRAGREKLGVELRVGGLLREGTRERPGYTLRMRLYGATLHAGTPATPQPFPDVTQYVAWRWDLPAALEPAARQGSLCSRLFLDPTRAADPALPRPGPGATL